jgi:hypothetical protein
MHVVAKVTLFPHSHEILCLLPFRMSGLDCSGRYISPVLAVTAAMPASVKGHPPWHQLARLFRKPHWLRRLGSRVDRVSRMHRPSPHWPRRVLRHARWLRRHLLLSERSSRVHGRLHGLLQAPSGGQRVVASVVHGDVLRAAEVEKGSLRTVIGQRLRGPKFLVKSI